VPGILEIAIKRLLAPDTTHNSLKVLCLEVVPYPHFPNY
jgi:hypothetical protein